MSCEWMTAWTRFVGLKFVGEAVLSGRNDQQGEQAEAIGVWTIGDSKIPGRVGPCADLNE